jgi:hypothetical protein
MFGLLNNPRGLCSDPTDHIRPRPEPVNTSFHRHVELKAPMLDNRINGESIGASWNNGMIQ